LIVYTMYEEGVFDTTKNSILLLISGINRFRRLEEEDLQQLKETEEQEKAEEKREDNNAKY
ncbi:MAG: sporulation integral membrane protein YtvI, partial [Acetatifactor sp.]